MKRRKSPPQNRRKDAAKPPRAQNWRVDLTDLLKRATSQPVRLAVCLRTTRDGRLVLDIHSDDGPTLARANPQASDAPVIGRANTSETTLCECKEPQPPLEYRKDHPRAKAMRLVCSACGRERVCVGTDDPFDSKPAQLTEEQVREVLKPKYCVCPPPQPHLAYRSDFPGAILKRWLCEGCGRERNPEYQET